MLEPSHDVILPTMTVGDSVDDDHSFTAGQEFGNSGFEGDFTTGREFVGLGVEGDFTIEDGFMNGSCMPGLTDSQEDAIDRAAAPPQVVGAVPDVLAFQQRSATARCPAALPAGEGFMALGAMMCQALGCRGEPGVEASDGCIDWRFPQCDDDPFSHCCRIINALDVSFYIGITENPRRRWGEHVVDMTVGPDPLMTVLIEARSSETTAAFEIELLKRYRHNLRCANMSSGGEGRSACTPHYLYVLHGSTPLIRRGRS